MSKYISIIVITILIASCNSNYDDTLVITKGSKEELKNFTAPCEYDNFIGFSDSLPQLVSNGAGQVNESYQRSSFIFFDKDSRIYFTLNYNHPPDAGFASLQTQVFEMNRGIRFEVRNSEFPYTLWYSEYEGKVYVVRNPDNSIDVDWCDVTFSDNQDSLYKSWGGIRIPAP
jgi:hypothetical protein